MRDGLLRTSGHLLGFAVVTTQTPAMAWGIGASPSAVSDSGGFAVSMCTTGGLLNDWQYEWAF